MLSGGNIFLLSGKKKKLRVVDWDYKNILSLQPNYGFKISVWDVMVV